MRTIAFRCQAVTNYRGSECRIYARLIVHSPNDALHSGRFAARCSDKHARNDDRYTWTRECSDHGPSDKPGCVD
jgi:hypothetical protein